MRRMPQKPKTLFFFIEVGLLIVSVGDIFYEGKSVTWFKKVEKHWSVYLMIQHTSTSKHMFALIGVLLNFWYLGANSSMVKPAFSPVRQYSSPLAIV